MEKRSSWKYYLIGPLVGFSVLGYEMLTNKTSCVYRQNSEIIKNEIPKDHILENRVLKVKFEDDVTLLAKLIWGESRGESKEIKYTIADSVINRTNKNKWWGNTLREVILKEKQYSCFNKNDVNYKKLRNPLGYDRKEVWEECLNVAKETLSEDNIDTSNGANHYYDTSIKEPKWTKNKKPVLILRTKKGKKIKFYKLNN